jgi:hypothetical protein
MRISLTDTGYSFIFDLLLRDRQSLVCLYIYIIILMMRVTVKMRMAGGSMRILRPFHSCLSEQQRQERSQAPAADIQIMISAEDVMASAGESFRDHLFHRFMALHASRFMIPVAGIEDLEFFSKSLGIFEGFSLDSDWSSTDPSDDHAEVREHVQMIQNYALRLR